MAHTGAMHCGSRCERLTDGRKDGISDAVGHWSDTDKLYSSTRPPSVRLTLGRRGAAPSRSSTETTPAELPSFGPTRWVKQTTWYCIDPATVVSSFTGRFVIRFYVYEPITYVIIADYHGDMLWETRLCIVFRLYDCLSVRSSLCPLRALWASSQYGDLGESSRTPIKKSFIAPNKTIFKQKKKFCIIHVILMYVIMCTRRVEKSSVSMC